MDTAIGGMLIIAVFLSMMVFLSRAFIVSEIQTGTALNEAAALAGDRSRTDLTVLTFTTISSDLNVEVTNTGETSVAEFDRMDYIVSYTATNNALTIIRLTFREPNPAAGEWEPNRTTISPDSFQPGIWNPGETLTLEGHISPGPKSGTTGTAWVSSPNGVVAIGQFTVP